MSAGIVVVGASLAGLRAAEALRDGGYAGALTIVGDEPHAPYDRPPLSKAVALGIAAPARTALPRLRALDATWRLGVAATGLDVRAKTVALATGESLAYDRVLIATGTRARPWHVPAEAALEGVLTLRTSADAAALRAALVAGPRRVVVIGGGFNGCEIASVARELGLAVTLVEHGPAPLASALGKRVGDVAAALQRRAGVDLRCGASVVRLDGARGRVTRAVLDGGDAVDADLVVVALGALPNVEWLRGSGLAAGAHGLACDPACRAYDRFGIARDDAFVAGDVARFPHPLFNYQFVTLEHWGNAVEQARVAAANALAPAGGLRPHMAVPTFWSSQFDVSIKSVGIPAAANRMAFAQGDPESGSFVALYGRDDRLVAAAGFDAGKWLPRYATLIAEGAAFPPPPGIDPAPDRAIVAADFPHPGGRGLATYITLSGHEPAPRRAADGTAA